MKGESCAEIRLNTYFRISPPPSPRISRRAPILVLSAVQRENYPDMRMHPFQRPPFAGPSFHSSKAACVEAAIILMLPGLEMQSDSASLLPVPPRIPQPLQKRGEVPSGTRDLG